MFCPQCGGANPGWARFCNFCGQGLPADQGATPPPATTLPPVYIPPPLSYYNPWEAERRKQLDLTKVGLILLMVAAIIASVPVDFIAIVVLLLVPAGIILMILGRGPFGLRHGRNVVAALALLIVGLVGKYAVARLMGSAVAAALVEGVEFAPAVRGALVAGFIIGAIAGLDYVLLTYELQRPVGRKLLVATYLLSLLFAILAMVVVSNALGVLQEEFQRPFIGPLDRLKALGAIQCQMLAVELLQIIPSLMLAVAF